MKLLLKKLLLPDDVTVSVNRHVSPCYEETLHFHPAFELIYVFKGQGSKFIGHSINTFKAGDCALISPDTPHLWRNDELKGPDAEFIEVHFKADFLGEGFFERPEMKPIKKLLSRSVSGLNITGSVNKLLADRIKQLSELTDEFLKVTALLDILNELACSNEVSPLLKGGYNHQLISPDTHRIDKVYKFIMNHFCHDITLEEIAEVANLSIPAFCKYFKKHAQKTFSAFLNEIKISHVCKLLIETNYSVSQICFESGFKSIASFNRQFKTMMQLTPYEYRQYYNHVLSSRTKQA
ncbi:AraC family transcriptional regulator (plasmid) [Pedobacter sp. BS3]|uniref:AraC family transcriptional regulator n=1 Tax=Pedobacter sp. BS3 TaxID=2567937 RepID=UPI0011ECDC4B|nr:AraC family transcriptional regulator [Pedobacter sp. BS3]TZF86468.1 AraC family transcriptional regulator [Pedobacter sp. BS3]